MSELSDSVKTSLIEGALEVRQRAYAPYSKFSVGAAILCESGKIYTGCNVENVSYGLTICAERVAACSAVAAGDQAMLACAICTSGGGTPCGACRQFLAQFGPSMQIVLIDSDSPTTVRQLSLSALLPDQFQF